MRVTQSGHFTPRQVLCAGLSCCLLACVFAIPLIQVGGWPIIVIGLVSLMMAYAYTSGPYPLSYKGVGEIFVILFFGFVAVGGMVYLLTLNFHFLSLLAGLQVGVLATVLLAINNLRDVEGDRGANKKTFPVRFGVRAAKIEIVLLILAPFFLQFFWLKVFSIIPVLLPFLALPLAFHLGAQIWKTEPSEKYNQFLAQAAALQLLFGFLLAGGFWWS